MSETGLRIGFIGGGNMAEAICRGLLAAGHAPSQIRVAEPLPPRREQLAAELGVETTGDNAHAASGRDVVVIAVKPDQLERALDGLGGSGDPLWLSIAAGCPTARLRKWLGADARVLRCMPNTPALVGSGISALATDAASEDDLARAASVLEAVGEVVRVPESAMDAVTGLSGSGPAYVYVVVEALTEAGIREGLSADVSRRLATATVFGAARMVRESGEHPAVLRERVTSPGGTTIAGLAALDAHGLRPALHAAVSAAAARSRELTP